MHNMILPHFIDINIDPAPAIAGAAPPKKKAPRSKCAIDTDR